MESLCFRFVALNAIFGMVLLAWARLVLTQRSPILWAYVTMSIIFVYGLPQQDYSTSVGLEVLLLSHLLMLLFFAMVLFLARVSSIGMTELRSMMNVPNWTFYVIAGAWLLWRVLLISIHGPAALMFSRAEYFLAVGQVEFSTWEVALSSITTLLLIGAVAHLVVCHAVGRRNRPPLSYLPAAVILVVVVLTNESPIGSRRLLLVLAALWISVNWQYSGLSPIQYLAKHVKAAALLVLLIGGLATYYQHVRNNDFSDVLAASEPSEVIGATLKFLTTINGEADESEVHYLRSGPFDFFTKVLDRSVLDGKSSNGEATLFSLALAVPKVVYPGVKPVGDVDDVLFRHLDIYPSFPFLQIDYPTSLPAIGVADFGPIGALAAGFVLSSCFVAIGWMIRLTQKIRLAPLLMLGLLVQLIGSQETGLTAVVSMLRDATVALVFLAALHQAVRLCYRICKRNRCLPLPVERG